MGDDSRGNEFSSVEEFWKLELDGNEELDENERKRRWYEKSMQYWSRQDATVDGVLAGYESVSSVDLEASINFLNKIKLLPDVKGGPCSFGRALDCGAGVGRVTAGCLTKCFEMVRGYKIGPRIEWMLK